VAATLRFTSVLKKSATGRVFIPLPTKDTGTTRLRGTVNDMKYRGEVEELDGERGVVLGPAWRRDCGLAAGDRVTVVLEPEGPQRGGLAPDFEAALTKNKKATAFWDSLATFYRKAYVTYIDATKRSPEKRVERIREVVTLLASGQKERPK
jgi:hypothetical protein